MEDKESSKYKQTRLPQQKASEEDILPSSITTMEGLADELLVAVFRFLAPTDLGRVTQVSKRFQRLVEDSDLWRYMGSRYYGDYLSVEDLKKNPKQQVIFHTLSVIINSDENLEKIEMIARNHNLRLFSPLFKRYIPSNLLMDLVTDPSDCEVFIAECNVEAIKKKLDGLIEGKYGYKKDPFAAREFNDFLVEKNEPHAISRKIQGLYHGNYGYEKNLFAVRVFNDFLVEKGDQEAIKRKIEGLLGWSFSYEKDLSAARAFNEFLVEKDDPEAIERKIKGLERGNYGYKQDLAALREFNEHLIEKEDPEAINRKVEGLALGLYGYEEDLEAARKFNELLVERGDSEAVKRKVRGFEEGWYGYEKDLSAARVFNDFLVGKDDPEAIERKIKGLSCGGDWRDGPGLKYAPYPLYGCYPTYGYQKDRSALNEFNDFLVAKGNPKATERKINGLNFGWYGYEKDPVAARKFNDLLVERGDPQAIQRKIEGILNNGWDYEKDSIAAKEFIESLVICEFPVARAIGKYVKAFAMKYGVRKLGYEKDREKAFKFIRENRVPY